MNARLVRPVLVALPLVSACALLMTLSGCASKPPRTAQFHSNPTTWDVREGAAPALRGQQRIALKNAYSAATKVVVWRWTNALGRTTDYEVDLKQFTDTAISMLERRMEKDRITIDATAAKSITLRVRDISASNPYNVATASATVDAGLGNGTKTSYQMESKSAGGWPRALDGAVVLALTSLLNDKEFQAYVNGP